MKPKRPESTSAQGRRRWLLALVALAVVLAGAYALLDGGSGEEVAAPPATDADVAVAPETTPERPSEEAAGEAVESSRFTLASEAVGEELAVSVLEPTQPAEDGRPLLVFLHGAGGSNESSVGDPAVLETLERLGARAPVVAFPDGQMSWWRDRPDGDWGRYVVREVIPAVTRRYGTDPRRVAIGGISMGGFGAYHLGLTYPRRFCAVGGHSAGLYLDYREASFGAFDSPADFRRNDVVAAVQRDPEGFGAARVWNDYGDEDWFVEGNALFVKALERGDADLTAHVWPGGHDGAYWSQHWPDYLRFYTRSLAGCDR